jgi:quercetin dioxygenase-like cupin family protein
MSVTLMFPSAQSEPPLGPAPARPAHKVIAPGEGEASRVLADLVTAKVTARDTGGAYSMFETRTEPGAGTPPYVQRLEDETFVVLEGVYTFLVDGALHSVGVGGVVFVARGAEHAYSNSTDAPARMLVITSPGGARERFVAEVGAPVVGAPSGPGGGPPDVTALLTAAARHGMELGGLRLRR